MSNRKAALTHLDGLKTKKLLQEDDDDDDDENEDRGAATVDEQATGTTGTRQLEQQKEKQNRQLGQQEQIVTEQEHMQIRRAAGDVELQDLRHFTPAPGTLQTSGMQSSMPQFHVAQNSQSSRVLTPPCKAKEESSSAGGILSFLYRIVVPSDEDEVYSPKAAYSTQRQLMNPPTQTTAYNPPGSSTSLHLQPPQSPSPFSTQFSSQHIRHGQALYNPYVSQRGDYPGSAWATNSTVANGTSNLSVQQQPFQQPQRSYGHTAPSPLLQQQHQFVPRPAW
eukprot:TRINITY_DN23735_c0_g1_i1.p1 TRINITY_DN23735_c0_g1~~TRINITY_DN23735_c0_g1_i1.p1  ORF type:complete len:327 (-),score=53.08 TRINITY_DN23735_c0_g1_i1:52-888(-)